MTHLHPDSPETILDGRFRLLQQVADDAAGPLFDALDESTGEVVRVRRPTGPVDERLIGVLHPRLAQPLAMSEGRDFIVYNDLGEQPAVPGADDRSPAERARWAAEQLLPVFEALHAHGVHHGHLGLHSVWRDAEGELRVMDLGLRPARGTARDDVFALATLLYTFAEGEAPRFDAGRAPWAPNLPSPVSRALMHAMDPRPVFRPQTAGDLRKALDEAWAVVDAPPEDEVDEAGPDTLAGAPLRVAEPPGLGRTLAWVAGAAAALAATFTLGVVAAGVAAAAAWAR